MYIPDHHRAQVELLRDIMMDQAHMYFDEYKNRQAFVLIAMLRCCFPEALPATTPAYVAFPYGLHLN